MKLRNGRETNKSLLVYFPEDVWKMILHKYLDINNYWRKCHMKHLRIIKPIHDDYVLKMCRRFADTCSKYIQSCPTYYSTYTNNKWKIKKRTILVTKVYELLITNWNVIKMGIIVEQKHGREETHLHRLIRAVERKSIQLRRQIRDEKEERHEEFLLGKYFSYENDKLLDKLLCKINIFEELIKI